LNVSPLCNSGALKWFSHGEGSGSSPKYGSLCTKLLWHKVSAGGLTANGSSLTRCHTLSLMMFFNGGKWEIREKSSAFVSKQSLRLPAAISEHQTGLIVVTGST
jgi:hypothetical protein